MVQVRGTVHDVSDNPDRVEKIIVRAVEPRMHGTTYITEEPTQFPVVDGVLDFNVLPGPCVVAFLRPHGATTYEKLLVPDVAEATFRECLDAAALAEEGTKSALEKVVRQIQEELNKAAPLVDEMRSLRTDVSNDRAAVDGFTKAAKASASAAASSETNAKTSETNAASSAASAKSQQESAKTHFNNTVTEAGKAASSAAAAKTSETNAASSASASASSASSSKDQADKSAASATQAASARDAANTSETNAAGSAAAAKTSETNSKQHETNAGDYAAVATTAATEAVDAMGRATEIAGGNFATQSDLSNAVANSLDVDTTLATWTADAVGGRNLLQGTSAEPTELNLTASMYYQDIPEDTLLEVGQRYTFSVIVDKLSDDDHPIYIQVGTGTGKDYTRDMSGRIKSLSGERVVISFTPTEYHLDGRTHLAWRIRNERKETQVAYREVKLERGPVATPWTPSPEDSVQSLSEGNSLPSPFPDPDPALSLRVDNSVGTRVFVGDVMVYGDTGWRDVTDSYLAMQEATGNVLTLGEGARILAKRTTSTLTYAFEGPITASRAWTNLFQPPKGFRPEYDMGAGFATKGRLEGNSMFIRLMGLEVGSFVDAGRVLSVTFPMSSTNWPITSMGDPA